MKTTKSLVSVLLALLLLACGTIQTAFAGEAAAPAERTEYPTIWLAGGFHELYTDYGTPEQKAYFDTSDSMVTDTETMGMVLAAATALDFNALGTALGRMFTKAYEGVAMNCDGVSVNPDIECSVTFYLPPGALEILAVTPDEYLDEESLGIKAAIRAREEDGCLYLTLTPDTPESTLYFRSNEGYYSFDWRLDPVYNAGLLNTWIKETFIDTDISEKVNLAFVSGSGPIGLAYLGEYGSQYLNAVTFNEGLHNGSVLWGGIATKQFGLSAAALGNTGPMYNFGLQDKLTPGIRGIVRVFYEIGVLDTAARVFNFAASDAFDRMYEEALIPMWFHMPFYWALVPHSMYEQAKRALFPTHTEYAAHARLFEKTDYYHNNILARSREIIAAAAQEIKNRCQLWLRLPAVPLFGHGLSVVGRTGRHGQRKLRRHLRAAQPAFRRLLQAGESGARRRQLPLCLPRPHDRRLHLRAARLHLVQQGPAALYGAAYGRLGGMVHQCPQGRGQRSRQRKASAVEAFCKVFRL